ncbi:30S ribosomal protein S5 [Candidatus Rickettsiella isopodorum]|jgi:small subunit ribosomal protein S5|uniref:Small ribosomal subunit protein uS5 n=1 Tax=Candidatus Rickettsiella isopodorum TaxID=1225476 RepID=A0A1J8NFX8_9COXI|nr:30S ribosomal protein S5 [Candidatus Rickettsiella isopodorum]OIZ94064.1 30S ribosomal protein S5 [Candidatus Rickettsiella isopodorum]
MSFDQSTKSDGLQEKLIAVNRHAKVVKGGRIFSFAAGVVVGDGKGRIGFSKRPAREVSVAMQKALEKARRDMLYVELNNHTIYHPLIGRHGATKVIILPAVEGTGIIAGGPMRAIFEVLGIKNVIAKIIGSSNRINVVRATLKALSSMSTPEMIADKRGKSIKEIYE